MLTAPRTSSWVKWMFKLFAHFELDCFFLLSGSYLYILDINLLIDLQIFSYSADYLSTLLKVLLLA
jgi:hypothetical protein